MICPCCGAEEKDLSEKCSMCGEDIDRERFYEINIRKGDELLLKGKPEAAAAFYKKAAEFVDDRAEVYIKAGTALMKKNDKSAASMYLKALKFDFYDSSVHSLLINLYDKFGKTRELKQWYEQNRMYMDEEFIEKQLAIIENTFRFKNDESMRKEYEVLEKNRSHGFVESIKRYGILNGVIGVTILLIAAGYIGQYFFKADMSFLFMFAAFFFFTAAAAVFTFRRLTVKKKKKQGKHSLKEYLSEFDIDDKE
ncbi:MAG: hypothetical protein ACLFP1_02770 [Candidatus Goldiibacteriota bacterium]